jgi:hypothetical protein
MSTADRQTGAACEGKERHKVCRMRLPQSTAQLRRERRGFRAGSIACAIARALAPWRLLSHIKNLARGAKRPVNCRD